MFAAALGAHCRNAFNEGLMPEARMVRRNSAHRGRLAIQRHHAAVEGRIAAPEFTRRLR